MTAERIRQFDFSVDVTRVIGWRHSNAVNFKQIIFDEQAWLDANVRDFWNDWAVDVFDLTTANDFGLAVWSKILDIPVFISNPSSNYVTWGFGDFNGNFRDSNFGGDTTNQAQLTTEQLRLVLRMRAFQLHTDSSPLQVNAFLLYLFGDQGVAYMRDNQDMTVTYVFDFALSTDVAFVLENYEILPTAPGVADNIEINP